MEFWKGPAHAEASQSTNGRRPAPLRLVLESSVFITAAQSPDSPSRRLLDAVDAGQATLLVSPAVFAEYRRLLPPALESEDQERLIRSWIGRAETVASDASQSTGDDKFVSLAVSGKADAIVSTEKRRSTSPGSANVPVLRPDEALERLS